MIPHTLTAQIAFALYAVVCLIILRIGQSYERIAGGAILAQLLLLNLMHDHVHGGPQYGLAGLDLLLLILLGTISYLSHKLWPLWATAFQLVATVVHGIKAIDPSIHGWAYLSTNILFGWLTLAAVLTGAWNVRRARSKTEPASTS